MGRLKQILDLAVELGTIHKNPCTGVKPPPMPHEETRVLTADQVATLADGMPESYRTDGALVETPAAHRSVRLHLGIE